MFEKELEIGEKAISLASRVIYFIQRGLTINDSFSKSDRSPVTIADFLSQAIICRILNDHFPDIPIVAEEDSKGLKNPENSNIQERMLDIVKNDEEVKGIIQKENLFESIDLGASRTSDLFWTLDPIDGTKGFLRGEQFAVALALIGDGEVKIGILGCPNLYLGNFFSPVGYLFAAIKGQGTQIIGVNSKKTKRIFISEENCIEQMRFVQSYVSEHSNTELQNHIAEILNIKAPPLHLDSQVKYGLISSGNAEIYLRIPNPKTPDYKEKIWDHAAGSLIVTEAGGVVTDIFGEKLNFSSGKTLKNNSGILATIPVVQKRILEIIRHCRAIQ